ncbi:hypothetical protein ABT150_47045 [Streptomyces mirabilis]
MPAAFAFADSGLRPSQSRETDQRPAASCERATADGLMPPGSGPGRTTAGGPVIFARLPEKWVNAACTCRSACWRGTEDTSFRQAGSSVFFHAVGIAGVRRQVTRS